MAYGQMIGIMMPLTLPWTFIMQVGLRNFGTKMNTVFYLILHFFILVFPIGYLFELLQEREDLLIKKRDRR